jgi:hypothetical protein
MYISSRVRRISCLGKGVDARKRPLLAAKESGYFLLSTNWSPTHC